MPTFDLAALYAAIESARVDHGLSMAALARSVGVASSTIARFAIGDPAATEADGVLVVIRWLGVVPEQFISPRSDIAGVLLDRAAPMVRADAGAMGLRPGSRASIAVVVAVAHRLGVPIASLTRGADC